LLGAPGEADGGLRAELSGRLSPRLDLAGTLASPRLPEPVAVTVDDRAGPSARLAWRELTATLAPTDGVSVALDGRAGAADLNALAALLGARLPAGLRAELAGADTALELQGLAWSGAGGWAGAARLHAAPPQLGDLGPLTLRASATPDGRLGASLAATPAAGGAPWLAAEALLPRDPWAGGPLAGRVRLDLPLTALAPGAPLEQRLLVDAGLGGSVADPTVDGSVTLDGALAATGDLAYRAGAGQLRLSGPELDLLATLAGGDVTAQAAVRGLALDGWLPQLPGGRLAFEARLTGSRVSLTDLALTAPGSRLTGAATVDLAPASGGPTLRSTLEANVDLASLALGDLELTGQLRGPVIVSASDLGRPGDAAVIANLAALRLGVAGVAGSVSGNLTLGGRLADPSLNLQLVG